MRLETGDTTNDLNDTATPNGPACSSVDPSLGLVSDVQAALRAQEPNSSAPAPAEADAKPERDTMRPEQQVIQDAWEAIGQDGVATDPPGASRKLYSGLVQVVKTHGEEKVREWVTYLQREKVRPPDGATPWLWFCAEMRRAMNQPWTWNGSRGVAKPQQKSADQVVWCNGEVDFRKYVA